MKNIFKLLILLAFLTSIGTSVAQAEASDSAESERKVSKKIELKQDVPEEIQKNRQQNSSEPIKATVNNNSTDLTEKPRPVPSKKPASVTITESKAGARQGAETSLISFAMLPLQVELDDNLNSFLKDYAMKKFKQEPKATMLIQSYASSKEDDKYQEVRISLARALEIRQFLMDNGISPKQIEIQAMTDKDNSENADRIDILFKKPEIVTN